VKVVIVEVKDVELPQSMQRAMARQAEAEREKRAKIIHAEGEFSAAQQLSQAAQVMATSPGAMQLRYLQTLTEISVEKNSTIIFPVQITNCQLPITPSPFPSGAPFCRAVPQTASPAAGRC
jgi:regulator of protease activity HflC (stomatin/prohibitin superfamily)